MQRSRTIGNQNFGYSDSDSDSDSDDDFNNDVDKDDDGDPVRKSYGAVYTGSDDGYVGDEYVLAYEHDDEYVDSDVYGDIDVDAQVQAYEVYNGIE